MTGGPRRARWLFTLATGLAGTLLALVLLAPRLDSGHPDPRGLARLAALFARDPAVRRTSLASALGLLVSACVFFRDRPLPRERRREGGQDTRPGQAPE